MESSEKVIDMPEDDPEAIAALIRWLYIGKYIYEGNRLRETFMDPLENPSKNLLEGLFHIGVHVVSFKYDCVGLLTQVRLKIHAMRGKLDGLDGLRLSMAAYHEDLRFPIIPMTISDPEAIQVSSCIDATKKWIHALFINHPEDIAFALSKFPELAHDLLYMSTLSVSGLSDFEGRVIFCPELYPRHSIEA